MGSQVVADFFTVLLLGGAVAVVALLVPRVRQRIRPHALPFAALVAIGATAGSLYFSEVAGFLPCELCWYQRIAMYPLALLLGFAALRSDTTVRRHALPLAVGGLLIAIYHVQLQAFPDQSSFCSLDHPCTTSPISGLGFLTIPQMSALSFATLIGLLGLIPTTTRSSNPRSINPQGAPAHEHLNKDPESSNVRSAEFVGR